MKMNRSIAIGLGVALGLVFSRFTSLGYITLIFWGLAGLGVGYRSTSKKEGMINGAFYGYFLSFFFMWAIYGGKDPIITKVPGYIVLGLFGALCGVILGYLGNLVKKK